MAQDGLAFRREDGMGASGVNAALACVLGLTDDIVVMFGDDGLVTLTNDSARRTLSGASGELHFRIRVLRPSRFHHERGFGLCRQSAYGYHAYRKDSPGICEP